MAFSELIATGVKKDDGVFGHHDYTPMCCYLVI